MRGPGPLRWSEAQLTLQLLAEERIGSPARRAMLQAVADEDAAAAAAASAWAGQVESPDVPG